VPFAGTVTDAGRVSALLLPESAAALPPGGADWFSVTVHMVEAPEFTLAGLQARPVTSMGATRVKEAVWEEPFKVAVTVALWVVGRVPAMAVKVAVVAPTLTLTEAGMLSSALLFDSATVVPPVGAAWFSVTVQVVAAPEFKLVGLQARPVSSVGATRVKLAVWDVPFRVAVTVADWVVVMVPAVAMKLAELAPAGTVTDAGIASRELLSDSAMVVLEEAGRFKPTVQVMDAPEDAVAGLQPRDVKVSGTVVIVPPVAVMGSVLADGEAPNALVMPIAAAAALGDIVADTTATTPFCTMFASSPLVAIPVRKQV